MATRTLFDTNNKLGLQHFFDELSRTRGSALLLDYDGTLSPFRLERDNAFPYPGVSMLLTKIMNGGHTRVVLISGRPAHEVVSLLGIVPHPEVWGVHGLQRLRSDGSCEMPPISEDVTHALLEADVWLDGLGLNHLAEHKPASLAMHWRGLPSGEQSDLRKLVLLGWLPVARRARMVLQDFDGGIEMRVPGRNKGDAVRTILTELDPDSSVAYLGDDETDEDAFNALAGRGLRVLVRPEWRETSADIWLKPPADLLLFLRNWLAACHDADGPLRPSYYPERMTSRGR